ncbi:sialic acid-binding Ig-like lectin 13 isoform X4 [Cavia porcellus]|uniref:sialic acid-binding Ig-like lectin 13 isoform X4 n=1 Tax=Cavia porcellus TaxID=10141 RepID=UPI002FE0EFB5
MQLHPDLLLLLPLQALLLLLWAQEGASLQGYYLDVNRSVTVQKGLCVHVPCKFTYRSEDGTGLGPVYGYWYQYLDGLGRWAFPVATNEPNRQVWEETRGRFLLTGDPEDNNCSLDIRYAKKRDEGSFYFRLEKGNTRYSYTDYLMSVRVTGKAGSGSSRRGSHKAVVELGWTSPGDQGLSIGAAGGAQAGPKLPQGHASEPGPQTLCPLYSPALTHRPDILIPGTLVSGRPSNLTCSASWACEQGTPPMFFWVGTSVSHLHPTVTSSPALTLTPRPQDHRTNLTCQVTLPGVSVTRRTTVHLSVSYPPQNLTVTIVARGASSAPTALENGSSLPVLEGQALRLLCAVDSYPPAMLTWSWGNLILCPSEPANPGVLELTPEHFKGEGELTCRAQNSLGSRHISLSLPWQGKSAPMADVVLVTIVEIAVKILLLGLCLIFLRVKSQGRKASRPEAEMHSITDYSPSFHSCLMIPLLLWIKNW